MTKPIFLQLNENQYHLADIFENIKKKPSDFIKINFIGNSHANLKGFIRIELTIHPTKTQRKEILKKEVRLTGFEDRITELKNHNINYMDIHPNIGYSNFEGKMLVIYQCNYQTFPPQTKQIDSKTMNAVLSLDIEFDDPFWLGIMFCRDMAKFANIITKQNITEFVSTKCHSGFIVIAAKKLIPEWEKYKLPKDRSALGHYTEHENFHINNE